MYDELERSGRKVLKACCKLSNVLCTACEEETHGVVISVCMFPSAKPFMSHVPSANPTTLHMPIRITCLIKGSGNTLTQRKFVSFYDKICLTCTTIYHNFTHLIMFIPQMASQDSSVSTVTSVMVGQPRNHCSIPSRGKNFPTF
jgi:hypothetical protein